MKKLAVYHDDTQRWRLIEADALAALAKLPENSVDAIVTDPPYGIGFAGEAWDSFGSTSDAFQAWTRKWAIQAMRVLKPGGHLACFGAPRTFHRLVAGIEDAGFEIRDQLLWIYGQGFPKSRRLPHGQATTLKPSYEPILLSRKPLDGNTTTNLKKWGTGALNIDTTRTGTARYWPANVTLSHSPDCPAAIIDGEPAGPSRLFYCAKAGRREREAGCGGLPRRSVALYSGKRSTPRLVGNLHPTVKPVSLMRWLVRLMTPSGGVVLDPFAGSGSTGIATVLEDRAFVGIEREGEYVDIACARLTHWAHEARRE